MNLKQPTFSVLVVLLASFFVYGLNEAKKPLGEVCTPEKNECGQHAHCDRISPCQMGTCACLGLKFRPLTTPNATDCMLILVEGARCNESETERLPEHANCVDSKVKCREHNEVSSDGICLPNSSHGGIGDRCDSSRPCDAAKQLQCSDEKRCQCTASTKLQHDGTCRTSAFVEACENDSHCIHPRLGVSSPSATASLCKKLSTGEKRCFCDFNNSATQNFRTQPVIFAVPGKDEFRARGVCLRVSRDANPSLLIGDLCTVPALEAFAGTKGTIPDAFCSWELNYACMRCPEDFESPPNTGRCRLLDAGDKDSGINQLFATSPVSQSGSSLVSHRNFAIAIAGASFSILSFLHF